MRDPYNKHNRIALLLRFEQKSHNRGGNICFTGQSDQPKLGIYICAQILNLNSFQALWISVTILMFMLKRRQKQLQARELAESLEDAKIFASSRQLDPSQNIMMRPMSDQVSF